MIIVFETDHLRCYQHHTSLLDIISQIRLCLLLADLSGCGSADEQLQGTSIVLPLVL